MTVNNVAPWYRLQPPDLEAAPPGCHIRAGLVLVSGDGSLVYRLVRPDSVDPQDPYAGLLEVAQLTWHADVLFDVSCQRAVPYRATVRLAGAVTFDALRLGQLYDQVARLSTELRGRWLA